MHHVVISTIRRGAVNPHEALDPNNQRMVDAVIEYEAARAEQEGAVQMSQWRARTLVKAPRSETIYGPAQRVLMKAMDR